MWTTRRQKNCISSLGQWTMVHAIAVILNLFYSQWFSIIFLDCLLGIKSSVSQPMHEDILNSTSTLLDNLLAEKNYNRQIRPDLGGPPTVITTDIEIRSFGPVSESEMSYSIDCYFRQTWIDSRLRFEHKKLEILPMNWKFLQKVWIPDTYFMNGKSSYLHKVTVPNKFIRLRKNGELKYSMRLTIKADCPMHLRKYPLDTQACPLTIGSFAYPVHDVSYAWKPGKAVAVSDDVILSQYRLIQIVPSNATVARKKGDPASSVLSVHFVLQRRRVYFILQIYAPCAMIVGASWVSFWINRSDAAGRVAVGATTVLTLVTMGFGGRGSLQKNAYATALDWFVIMCFTFVFAALVEYAFVNFIDHCEKQQLKTHLEKEREKKKKEEMPEGNAEVLEDVQTTTATPLEAVSTPLREMEVQDNRITSVFSQQQKQTKSLRGSHPTRLGGLRLRRRPYTGRPSLDKNGFRTKQIAGVVDRYARITFPLTFAFLNVLYWTLYLHTIDDEINLDIKPDKATG